MRKLTAFVAALVLAFAFLAHAGTPAWGNEIGSGPTVTAAAQPLGIKLAWTYPENPGAVGFIIRRGAESGKQDGWPLTDFPVTGRSWVDEDVVPGTTYYYVVAPVLGDGTVGFDSEEVSVTAVSPAADRRLVHFHLDESEALLRTADGDEMIVFAGKPLVLHGRVLLALDDLVALTGAEIAREGRVLTHTLPSGRVMTMEVEKSTLAFAKAVRTDTCHPVERNGQVYLPLRWIVEAMEGELSFNPVDGSVTFELAR